MEKLNCDLAMQACSMRHMHDKINEIVDNLGGAAAAAAYNLLDNSYFKKPVNQRGSTTYSAAGYTIDRWKSSSGQPVTVTADGIVLDGTSAAITLTQLIPELSDGVYTIAAKANGHINVRQYSKSGNTYTQLDENANYEGGYILLAHNTRPAFMVHASAGSTVTVEWAALYEGAYTAETLPAYVPKGYAAELLECQRYYYAIPDNSDIAYIGYSASATIARITLPTPVPMISKPTIIIEDVTRITLYAETNPGPTTAVNCNGCDGNAISLYCTSREMAAWKPCVLRFNTPAALSADL